MPIVTVPRQPRFRCAGQTGIVPKSESKIGKQEFRAIFSNFMIPVGCYLIRCITIFTDAGEPKEKETLPGAKRVFAPGKAIVYSEQSRGLLGVKSYFSRCKV